VILGGMRAQRGQEKGGLALVGVYNWDSTGFINFNNYDHQHHWIRIRIEKNHLTH